MKLTSNNYRHDLFIVTGKFIRNLPTALRGRESTNKGLEMTPTNCTEIDVLSYPNFDSYLTAKVHSCLVDRAIMLPPHELESNLHDSAAFKNGDPLHKHNKLALEDVKVINNRFWEYPSDHKEVIDGFIGMGIIKHEGMYNVIVYGDKLACDRLSSTVSDIQNKHLFPISCQTINKPQFAHRPCPGGSRIRNSNSSASGIITGWFNSNIHGAIGITNNHVAVDFGNHGTGTSILNEYNEKIGEVLGYRDLIPFDTAAIDETANLVDIAWIKPVDPSIASSDHNCLSTGSSLKGLADLEENYRNDKTGVLLCGNPHGPGDIHSILTTFYIIDSGVKYKFIDIIQINTGRPGQSGSLVLDDENKAGGIFFAAQPNENYGYAYPCKHIDKATQLGITW